MPKQTNNTDQPIMLFVHPGYSSRTLHGPAKLLTMNTERIDFQHKIIIQTGLAILATNRC